MRCRRCGKTRWLQWAHVYSRRYLCLRWNPANTVTLCPACHFWQHQNPIEAGEWLNEQVSRNGSSRQALASLLKSPTKPDLDEVYEYLSAVWAMSQAVRSRTERR